MSPKNPQTANHPCPSHFYTPWNLADGVVWVAYERVKDESRHLTYEQVNRSFGASVPITYWYVPGTLTYDSFKPEAPPFFQTAPFEIAMTAFSQASGLAISERQEIEK